MNPVITDHAVIRYLERVKGLDIEQIKNDMLPTRIPEAISRLGTGKYPLKDGYRAVVVENRVVTILPPKGE